MRKHDWKVEDIQMCTQIYNIQGNGEKPAAIAKGG